MRQKLTNIITKKRFLVGLLAILLTGAVFVIFCFYTISEQRKYIYTNALKVPINNNDIILVLGGGVNPDGTPKALLKARLDAAAELFSTGNYRKILVSGDNRFFDYNEPEAMKKYLTESKNINIAAVQEDNAGRSTYESCERAKKVFGLDRVVIVSQDTHLPRAIYLCKSFGINTVGYRAQPVDSVQKSQSIRELFANVKAILNVYTVGEKTVLGNKIEL